VIPSPRRDLTHAPERPGADQAAVAHDLNNMLAVIQGHAEMLLDDVGDESPLCGDLDAIRRAADRASSLLRHFLAVNGHED
jgi:signal transduction histidine kinase